MKMLMLCTLLAISCISTNVNSAYFEPVNGKIIVDEKVKMKTKLSENERLITFDNVISVAHRVVVEKGQLAGEYWMIHERYEGLHALVKDNGEVILVNEDSITYSYVGNP